MSAWRSWLLALLGCLGVIGSVHPLAQVWRYFQQPERADAESFDAAAGLHAHVLSLPPARAARLRLDFTVRSSAVTTQRQGDREHRLLRYRVPFTLVAHDTGGAELARFERVVDWAEPGSHAHRRADVGADGGTADLSYDFPGIDVPADGRVQVDLAFADDRTHGTRVTAAALGVDARGDNVAVPLVIGVFMLFAGWVAGICGLALLVCARTPAAGAAHVAPAVAHNRAMWCHLAAFAGYLLPFANVVLVCALWLRGRTADPFVERHGREALNFQLSLLVYLLLAFSLSLAVLGLLMVPLLVLFHVVSTIEGAVRARRGESYRYPLTFRFLRAPAAPTAAAVTRAA